MPFQTTIEADMRDRILNIVESAAASQTGMQLEFESKYEATRFRYWVYLMRQQAQRAGVRTGPLLTITMKLKDNILVMANATNSIRNIKIIDLDTNKPIAFGVDEDQISALMHEYKVDVLEARRLYAEGKRPSPEILEMIS